MTADSFFPQHSTIKRRSQRLAYTRRVSTLPLGTLFITHTHFHTLEKIHCIQAFISRHDPSTGDPSEIARRSHSPAGPRSQAKLTDERRRGGGGAGRNFGPVSALNGALSAASADVLQKWGRGGGRECAATR